MADDAKKKKAPAAKPPGGEKKPAAPKKDKEKAAKVEAAKAETAAKKEKEKEKVPPRPPADPRLKYFKKFHGKFLPRGPLRTRHQELLTRWNSGEDHGGVTVAELQGLLADWKAARAKPTTAKV